MEKISISSLLGRTEKKDSSRRNVHIVDGLESTLELSKSKKTIVDYNLHRFVKCKLDCYDKNLEAELFLTGKYIYSEHGIKIINGKIYFDNLDSHFEKIKKWSIRDYIEYYLYITQVCRTIMVYRNGKYVRLTPSMAHPQEMELLSKLSIGLRKIEKIVTDHFDKYTNLTYDNLIPKGFEGFELPLLK